MTPDQARAKARAILGEVADGKDPAAARDDEREAPTLAQAVDRYLDDHIRPIKKASTAALYTHYLRGLVAPALGSKKLASVTHADVLKLRTSIGRTRPVTANRVVAALSGLFTYAAKTGYVTGNPARE